MRILSIGHDDSLFEEGLPPSESQARLAIYAERLDQRKTILVMARRAPRNASRILAGGRIDVHAVRGVISFSRMRAAIRLARELCRRDRFDLVEYQDPLESGIVAAEVAMESRLPLAGAVFHDRMHDESWVRFRPDRRWALGEAWRVLKASRIVRADSRCVSDRLAAAGVRAVYVPFFISDLGLFRATEEDARAREAARPGDFRMLVVSALARGKGIDLALAACDLWWRGGGDGRLSIAGEGPERGRIEGRIGRLGMAGRVDLLGRLSREKTAAAMKCAHLLLAASRSESRARILIEARVACLPVVATDTAGAREVIQGPRHGIVVPLEDAGALCDGIRALRGGHGKFGGPERESSRRMEEEHGAEGVLPRLADYYREAIS